MSDCYETIGVPRGATTEEITKAYRALARQHHPDRNPGDPDAEAKFKEIQSAYETLSDPEKRRQYDRGESPRPTPRRGKPFNSAFDDFFSSVFGDKGQTAPTGENIVVEATVTLDQVRTGAELDLKYQRKVLCESCDGLGGEVNDCGRCAGSGVRVVNGPNMKVQASCDACHGSGKVLSQRCPDCDGGVDSEEECVLKFTLHPGVEDGMRFVRPGLGHPGPGGSEGGRLFIVVRVLSHEFFERLPNGHVMVTVPVTYPQLVLGASIDVPSLDSVVKFKLPPGAGPGSKFRLRGLGLPLFTNSGTTYNRGDQIVQIRLEVPKSPDGRHKELLEELAALETAAMPDAMREYLDTVGGDDGRSEE